MAVADDILSEIVRAPDDDHPRLVWADAVGGERGELVALQCGRTGAKVDHRARNLRERALLAQHGHAWSGLAERAVRVQYRRGFVDAIEVDATVFAEHGDAIVAAAPLLTSITLVGLCENEWRRDEARERLERVLRAEAFRQIRGLAILETVRGLEDILIAAGALRQLRALEVPMWRGGVLPVEPDTIERFAESAAVSHAVVRAMPRLAALDVFASRLGAIGDFEHLVDLSLRTDQPAVLAALAASPVASRLERLAFVLTTPPLDAAFVRLLTRFPRLRTLELLGPGLTAGLVELDLPALRELHVCQAPAELAAIEARFGAQLDVLVTRHLPEDVELFAAGPRLPGRWHVRRAIGAAHREPAWLALLNGQHAGEVWPLHAGEAMRIGRGDDSDVHLAFDTVARLHAMVFWRDGRYWIEDRRSDNGTYLDGKIVGVGVLFDNVRVQLGRASLVFCTGTDAEQRAGVAYANEGPAPASRNRP